MQSVPPNAQTDLTALINQVKALEAEKERLAKELESKQRVADEEKRKNEENSQKMARLTEGKRNEMQQVLDNVIKKWLEDSVKDENLKKQFETGMTRLVDNTEEDNGVWQVVCCASNLHLQRLQELEALKGEVETLRTKGTPEFQQDGSRKRGRDEGEKPAEAARDIWSDFADSLKGYSYTPAL